MISKAKSLSMFDKNFGKQWVCVFASTKMNILEKLEASK
jgi:hypothetical protein